MLWVINPLSTQLKGYQPKIKQPGCLSRLITPWKGQKIMTLIWERCFKQRCNTVFTLIISNLFQSIKTRLKYVPNILKIRLKLFKNHDDPSLVLWVINPLSTQLKGYQPKIKQPGCISRLITPRVNTLNKQPGLFKIRVTTQKWINLLILFKCLFLLFSF